MKNEKMKRPPMKKGVLGRILKMLFKSYKWQMVVVTLCIVVVSMASTIASLFMNQFILYIDEGLKNGLLSYTNDLACWEDWYQQLLTFL